MAHFARIKDNIVQEVIVADPEFIQSGALGDPAQWIQTSYNTQGGVHRLGGTPLRKNYAGVGYLYIPEIDAFTPPRPYESWVLDEATGTWNAPIPQPNDPTKSYHWNDQLQRWDEADHVLPSLITGNI